MQQPGESGDSYEGGVVYTVQPRHIQAHVLMDAFCHLCADKHTITYNQSIHSFPEFLLLPELPSKQVASERAATCTYNTPANQTSCIVIQLVFVGVLLFTMRINHKMFRMKNNIPFISSPSDFHYPALVGKEKNNCRMNFILRKARPRPHILLAEQ